MAKDPAVLFYTSDFLASTYHLSNEQVGIFIRLLCLQHLHGRISPEDMPLAEEKENKKILDLFVFDGDGYYNKRMEEEILKRKSFCKSRRENKTKSMAKAENTPVKAEEALTEKGPLTNEEILESTEVIAAEGEAQKTKNESEEQKAKSEGKEQEVKSESEAQKAKNESEAQEAKSEGKEQEVKSESEAQEAKGESKEQKDKSESKRQKERERLSRDFARFWSIYPKKVAKVYCERIFFKLKPTTELAEQMIRAVENQKRWEIWQRERGKYIPNPSTWLNQQRWLDEGENMLCKPENEEKRMGIYL
ncbi:MAG: DUF1376 domain-containing protein [Ruminococcaceae bacterium]|nr:DUF1376 domain-containing protein [Oscillospiraceae bacterium]